MYFYKATTGNIMQSEKNKKIKPTELTPELYDLYAPPVYGKILGIVHKAPIADKILEKVFITAYTKENPNPNSLQSPLMSLLNQAREKSYKTIKALTILNECFAGATIQVTKKV